MNEEIKEILEQLEWYRKIGKKDVYYPEYVLPNKKAFLLLDYITNLQQENKEWGMIFDTFSSRPYAHRYLEEKRKELGNKRIIGLDSEMIYKEYYDLKEIEQDHKQTNATLMSELAKLEEENERLKELCDEYEEEHSNEFKIWKEERHELLDYKSRCEKAIEYIKSYKNDYAPYELSDYNVRQLLNILQNGSENDG